MSGTDYLWESGPVKLKRAILPRIERNDTRVTGASGTAFYLDSKSAKYVPDDRIPKLSEA